MSSSSTREYRVKEKSHVVPRLDWNSLQFGMKLGEGRFGEVYAATTIDSRTNMAIKILPAAAQQQLNLFWLEVNVLGDLHHPNILQLIGVGKNNEGQLFVATEKLDSDLLRYMTNTPDLSLFDRLCLIRDLASGVAWLHTRNPPIIHRDLKPANCLITPHGILKLADFGLAVDMSTELSQGTGFGTILYHSPEILIGKKPSSAKSDVYAFALVAWSILTSKSPFEDYEILGILEHFTDAIERGVRPELPEGENSPISNLLVKCWDHDPEMRPDMRDIVTQIDDIILDDMQRLPDYLKQFWENFNILKLSDRHTVSWSSFAHQLLGMVGTSVSDVDSYMTEQTPSSNMTSRMLSCLKLLLFNDVSATNNSRVNFRRFYQVFGTLAYRGAQRMGELLDHLLELVQKDYFFGYASPELTSSHLQRFEAGTPIVRVSGSSTHSNWLTISIIPPGSPTITHFRIFHLPGEVYTVYLNDNSTIMENTLPQLIDKCYPKRSSPTIPTPYAEYFQNPTQAAKPSNVAGVTSYQW